MRASEEQFRLTFEYAPMGVTLVGLDGVFPVAKTEIGNLAAIASEEILYPEIARAHALRGAEIFVHSSSEIGSPMATPKMIAKRARAFENLTYVISANTAGILDTALPEASADGNRGTNASSTANPAKPTRNWKDCSSFS